MYLVHGNVVILLETASEGMRRRQVTTSVSRSLCVPSHLSLCRGSAGPAGELPALPGPDPLPVGRTVPDRPRQVRARLPLVLPHLQRCPPSGERTPLDDIVHASRADLSEIVGERVSRLHYDGSNDLVSSLITSFPLPSFGTWEKASTSQMSTVQATQSSLCPSSPLWPWPASETPEHTPWWWWWWGGGGGGAADGGGWEKRRPLSGQFKKCGHEGTWVFSSLFLCVYMSCFGFHSGALHSTNYVNK